MTDRHDHDPLRPEPGEHDPLIVPVAAMPPSDLVEQTVERAAQKVAGAGGVLGRHHHPAGFAMLGANLILILALFLVRAGDRRTILRSNEIIREGIGCLLADLDDHRHTNQDAHEALARNHGFGKILQPDIIPLSPEQAQQLKALCNEFIRAGSTSLRHLGQADPHEAAP